MLSRFWVKKREKSSSSFLLFKCKMQKEGGLLPPTNAKIAKRLVDMCKCMRLYPHILASSTLPLKNIWKSLILQCCEQIDQRLISKNIWIFAPKLNDKISIFVLKIQLFEKYYFCVKIEMRHFWVTFKHCVRSRFPKCTRGKCKKFFYLFNVGKPISPIRFWLSLLPTVFQNVSKVELRRVPATYTIISTKISVDREMVSCRAIPL